MGCLFKSEERTDVEDKRVVGVKEGRNAQSSFPRRRYWKKHVIKVALIHATDHQVGHTGPGPNSQNLNHQRKE